MNLDEKPVLENDNGITVAELFEYLKHHIEKFGDDGEVWFETGENLSSPTLVAIRLNKNDILIGRDI